MFDYSKLDGKITEVFKTRKNFSSNVGWSEATVSNKLNNKTEFTQEEIILICKKLDIPITQISQYFFNLKV